MNREQFYYESYKSYTIDLYGHSDGSWSADIRDCDYITTIDNAEDYDTSVQCAKNKIDEIV